MDASLFGKIFKTTFLLLLIGESLSFWAQSWPTVNLILFCLISLAVFYFTWQKLRYGLYVLLAELFIGSKGYLFFAVFFGQKISIRMAIFAIVLAIWLIKWLTKSALAKTKESSFYLSGYLVLFIFLVLSALNGLLNHNFTVFYLDFNGWLYFLLAPVFFTALKEKEVLNRLLSILFAAALYLSVKTLFILTIFTQSWPWDLPAIYQWIRNSGVGEITYVSGNFYRIFFQSQLYVLIALLIALTLLILKPDFTLNCRRWLYCLVVFSSTAILASLSRSFWVGAAVATAAFFILLGFRFNWPLKRLLKLFLVMAITVVLEIFFLQLITGGLTGKILTERLADSASEAAGISRLNQLPPLWLAVSRHWLLGSGFGQEVTYLTNDPRLLKKNPDGHYTTSAFEWGFLDIWLKIGLAGLIAYFYLIAKIVSKSLTSGALGLGLFLALIAVVFTNIFSPYLNHPLGIGFILLTSASLNGYEQIS